MLKIRKRGIYDEAVSSFQHVFIRYPRHVEAESNLGLCWRELNRLDEAKAAFQSAIDWQSSAPSDSQPYLNLGAILVDQDNFEATVPLLSKAVGLSPCNPKIHEELGIAYEGQNSLPEAQVELERVVPMAPKISGLHFKLANLYRKEGLRDLAKQEFQICARLNSTHSSTETPDPFIPSPAGPH
ncbi:tetratricopeptide repeat protein [Acidicapsa acidisoli]|uniref:tetratricopeptide repeat protein n=1 Tax=Acidicapsa acidisoli TaxID=1615681 RepID=UPI0021E0EFAC|nr:tetratricopeptide repeat protein [Acidicapsa acidisoli]